MKALRSLVIASTLVGSLAVAPAAMASGRAPTGHGLVSLTGQDDIDITNLVCDDATVTEIFTPRGGLATWVLGETDRMYVVTSISGEGTVTRLDGSSTYTFSASYGRKAGLGETVSCSMDYELSYRGVTDTGVMDVTVVRVW